MNSFTHESFSYIPDDILEQSIIHEHTIIMRKRAPGKYNELTQMLHLLSHIPMFSDCEVPYFFGRIADDIVDDDLPLPRGYISIPEWIEVMTAHLHNDINRIPKSTTAEFLLKRTVQRMEQYDNLDIRGELLRFLHAMRREYDRRIAGASLSQEELEQLYQEEFGSPHTIMLAAFRSRLREKDVPELGIIQGRRYALDGMKDDLRKNIIGIPTEVLEKAGMDDHDAIQLGSQILSQPIIARWRDNEIAECNTLAIQLLSRPLDIIGRMYVKALL